MSRSRALVMSIAALWLILPARPAPAQMRTLVDAFGSVDYAHGRSVIQVGSWVKFRLSGTGASGVANEYTSTLLIAGEEEFWGEDCFWVETHTRMSGGQLVPAATLVSFAIFDDSLAIPSATIYQRKRITEADENGRPLQQLMLRAEGVVKSREPLGPGFTWRVDTLGTDTVRTAKGDFVCLVVRREQGVGQTAQSTDSTQYTEIRKRSTTYISLDVPVTRAAREVFETETTRRTWLTGRSRDAGPLRIIERVSSTAELLDFGTSGVEAMAVPEHLRRPLAEQRAAKAKPARPRAGAAPAEPVRR